MHLNIVLNLEYTLNNYKCVCLCMCVCGDGPGVAPSSQTLFCSNGRLPWMLWTVFVFARIGTDGE